MVISDKKCIAAVLKLARLGRTSFRAVKSKRDYVTNKFHYNWLYLSRISALNEFKFLDGLYHYKKDHFPIPKPYDHNRHAIIMEYIPSFPLCRIEDLGNKEKAYNELISIILRFASKGLIHGDFNEFNILINAQQKIYVIDFPQMISIDHKEAKEYFLRDIQCINKFFKKKFGMEFDNNDNIFEDIIREDTLDIELKAYGHENAVAKYGELKVGNVDKLNIEEDNVEDKVVDNKTENEDEDNFLNEDINVKNQEFTKDDKIEISSNAIKYKVKKMLMRNEIEKMNHGKGNKNKNKKKIKIK
jgi:RIO kinase 2